MVVDGMSLPRIKIVSRGSDPDPFQLHSDPKACCADIIVCELSHHIQL